MSASRSVVVTGASQGIGAEIALALSAPKTTLALVARNAEKLEQVGAQCRALGARVLIIPCDVTIDAEVDAMARRVTDEVGTPDIVVNNAGAFIPGSIAKTETDVFRGMMDVNLVSAYMVSRAFLTAMSERGSGHFVFMGSVASIKGYPGGVAYCAAKHGLLGLARALREESKEAGLRVTTLLPGATLTPSWDGSGVPEDRFMPAKDIAQAVRCAVELSGMTVMEEIVLRPQPGDL